jgi:TniQ
MQILTFDDPEWLTTFPCRVAPLSDEWLTGLLLRCDEVNYWESGTTFWLIATRSAPKDRHLWKSHMKHKNLWKYDIPSFFLPHQVNVTTLARYLGLSEQLCVSTTYAEELIRCYDLVSPPSRLLYPYFAFRVCPACLAEKRLLRRMFLLPCLRYCPHHQVALLKICTCGKRLYPFNRSTLPFICPSCFLDWAHLPLIQMQASHLETEQKLLSHYAWILTQGTPTLFKKALERISEKLVTTIKVSLVNGTTWDRSSTFWTTPEIMSASIGAVVIALVSLSISPQEVFSSEKPKYRSILLAEGYEPLQALKSFLFAYATKPDETCDGGYARSFVEGTGNI